MKRRRKTSSAPAPMPPAATVAKIGVARVTGWKLWSFRALAAFGVPLVLLGLLELVLRVTGYGHPTGFFKTERHNGREILVQNNQFGWRFFGPEMARRPNPLAISPAPAGNTVRIVVLGESAAKGDPDPHFGLPRMLEATLSLRHPGMRFEVINAAMTAINSHAVRLIARDCVPLKSDLWVIYMGNNEVVGPFGAGTVFGPQSPPLALVRSALALQTTRTGQWLDAGIQWARKSRYESPEWGGMEMFLDQQVPADDPRMGGVYHHFERNLSDILDVARSAGVGVVVSTVAVNLKDCAPFASAHRADLSAGGRARWEEEYQLGVAAQRAGNTQEAAQRFQAAAQIDDSFAELRFRLGQCALARGEVAAARVEFRAARDLDTLRFRCDSRLNTLARKVVSDRGGAACRAGRCRGGFCGPKPR